MVPVGQGDDVQSAARVALCEKLEIPKVAWPQKKSKGTKNYTI